MTPKIIINICVPLKLIEIEKDDNFFDQLNILSVKVLCHVTTALNSFYIHYNLV